MARTLFTKFLPILCLFNIPDPPLSTTERIQVGMETVSPMVDTDGLLNVTRSLTLFGAQDQDTGSFSCRASTTIPGIGLQTDIVPIYLVVQGEIIYISC